MTEVEQILVEAAARRLAPIAHALSEDGWHPEIVVFAPSEIERIPGYKVAVVLPISSEAT